MTLVRPETPADVASIRALTTRAFGGTGEAVLVDRLRARGALVVSWVAEYGGEVVGHVAFSPVALFGAPAVRCLGLGPMAVAPERQRGGVGSLLVRAGLARCRDLGGEAVVVLGHPEYYPRFGFLPASRFGVRCAWDVPDEVFMALELCPGALRDARGPAAYAPEFDDVE